MGAGAICGAIRRTSSTWRSSRNRAENTTSPSHDEAAFDPPTPKSEGYLEDWVQVNTIPSIETIGVKGSLSGQYSNPSKSPAGLKTSLSGQYSNHSSRAEGLNKSLSGQYSNHSSRQEGLKGSLSGISQNFSMQQAEKSEAEISVEKSALSKDRTRSFESVGSHASNRQISSESSELGTVESHDVICEKRTNGSDEDKSRFKRSCDHRLSHTTLPVDELLDFGLNSFGFQRQEMCTFYTQIMQFLGCQSVFDVKTLVILTFVVAVKDRYRMVPYHNLTHAFSITQFLFAACTKSASIKEILTDLDILALFTAAPVHDIDHPGNNNAWEVATKSDLAIRYNDVAVLENHHAATGLEIMKDTEKDMFGTLSSEQIEYAKETFVYAILQTDMAQHFKIVDHLKRLHSEKGQPSFDKDSAEDRRYLAGVLLHSVDISNPVLPDFELSRKWSERINEEFLNQYRNELKAGLPETKMWATLDTNVGFYKSQVGFIDFIVAPLWVSLTEIFQDLEEKAHPCKNVESNKVQWQQLAHLETAQQGTRQKRFQSHMSHRASVTTLPVDDLLDFGLNSFGFQQQELCTLYVQIVQFVGCQNACELPTNVIMNYMDKARHGYRMVPYHNLIHAFSITQFLFATYFNSKKIADALQEDDVLALFAASPVHDIDHPGNNNAWEVATKSELAIRYNDTAVLENHHAATGLDIMNDKESDMFCNLSRERLAYVRETFVYAILQTDMAQHFRMVDKLKELNSRDGVPYRESAEERRYLAGVLLHAVDISNPVLPDFELSRKWAERINEEFLNQYRSEKRLGLPQTKMWATIDSNIGFYKSQVGFIDFLVAPLWNEVTNLFEDLEQRGNLRGNMATNKRTWQQLIASVEATWRPTRSPCPTLLS